MPPLDPARVFDVAIAGAGLAGASLAWRLARRGARVALFDAGTFPREKLCGEFLSPEGGEALERLGLADDLDRTGFHAIRRVRISTPRGQRLEAEIVEPGGRPGLGLSRSTLDDLLVRHAKAAGAIVFEACRVAGPVIEEGRVVGLRVRPSGRLESVPIRAVVVVAADGRQSALVRQSGRTRVRSRLRPRHFGLKRHLIVHDESAAEPSGTVGLHLVPGGYGGTCRIEGRLLNFCALLPESALRWHRGDLDRLADDYLGRNPILARLRDATEPAGPWKSVAGVRVELATPRFPGILYAGDCQGTVDPLGGQGMTMALLGSEALAPAIERALVSGGVSARLQRDVLAAWQERFGRRVVLCRLFHQLLVHPSLIDLACLRPALASRLLATCYRRTRDTRGVGRSVVGVGSRQ